MFSLIDIKINLIQNVVKTTKTTLKLPNQSKNIKLNTDYFTFGYTMWWEKINQA